MLRVEVAMAVLCVGCARQTPRWIGPCECECGALCVVLVRCALSICRCALCLRYVALYVAGVNLNFGL
jgi:hypothetical protein